MFVKSNNPQKVITKDLIRNVIVPQEKADRTILLEKSMAQHIEEKSFVKSKEVSQPVES